MWQPPYGTDERRSAAHREGPERARARRHGDRPGEQHIEAGAKAIGVSAKMLSFIDLLPVLAYPFLLWAAWILHRRNSRDVVSSILSIAVLFTIAARAAIVGVPGLHAAFRAG